jgi:hypothetical protein
VDDYHALALGIADMIKSFKEWTARQWYIGTDGNRAVKPISDSVAIGELAKLAAEAERLLRTYKESRSAEIVADYIRWLNNQVELDVPSALTDLNTLNKITTDALAVNHGIKDHTEKRHRWDETFQKKPKSPQN